MDIAAWLRGLGLAQYEPAFRENAIDSTVLRNLTAEDLKDLGVVLVGPRRVARWLRRTQNARQVPAVVNIGSRVTGAENLAGGERRLCIDLTDQLTGRPTTPFGAPCPFPCVPTTVP